MIYVKYGHNANIPLLYHTNTKRTFELLEDISVEMSDGRTNVIKKGFKTDLSSVPMWLWSWIRPFDKGLLADLNHDDLYEKKKLEIAYFGSSKNERKFADEERKRMREIYEPKKKIKNFITHKVVRWIGWLLYDDYISVT